MSIKIKKVSEVGDLWENFLKQAVLDPQTTEKLLFELPQFQYFSSDILRLRKMLQQVVEPTREFVGALRSKTPEIMNNELESGVPSVEEDPLFIFDDQEKNFARELYNSLTQAFGYMRGLLGRMENSGVERQIQNLGEEGQIELSLGESLGELMGVDDSTLAVATEILHAIGFEGENLVQRLGQSSSGYDIDSLITVLDIVIMSADSSAAALSQATEGQPESSVFDWRDLVEGDNQIREAILGKYNMTLEELLLGISETLKGVAVNSRSDGGLISNKIKDFITAVRQSVMKSTENNLEVEIGELVNSVNRLSKDTQVSDLDNYDMFSKYYSNTGKYDISSLIKMSPKFQYLIQDIQQSVDESNAEEINGLVSVDYSRNLSIRQLVNYVADGNLQRSLGNIKIMDIAEYQVLSRLAKEIQQTNYKDAGLIGRYIKQFELLKGFLQRKGISDAKITNSIFKAKNSIENDNWFGMTNAMSNFLETVDDSIRIIKTAAQGREGAEGRGKIRGVTGVNEDDIKKFDNLRNNLKIKYGEFFESPGKTYNRLDLFYTEAKNFFDELFKIGSSQKLLDFIRGGEAENRFDFAYPLSSNLSDQLFKLGENIFEEDSFEEDSFEEDSFEEDLIEKRISGQLTFIIIIMLKDLKVLEIYIKDFSSIILGQV